MDSRSTSPHADLSAAAWLADRLTGQPGRVESVVPVGFQSYARILHRTGHAAGSSGRWSEVARHCGTLVHALSQFQDLAGRSHRSSARQDWPGGEPLTGTLDWHSTEHLIAVLGSHTRTPGDTWLAIWDGWGSVASRWAGSPSFRHPGPGRTYHLFGCELDDVPALSIEFEGEGLDALYGFHSPNIWWPQDRAWVVGTEVDFDSTLIAGSAALIGAIVAHPVFEAYRVLPGDDLSFDGDVINRRPDAR